LRALGEPPAEGPWAVPPPLRAGAAPDRPIGTAEASRPRRRPTRPADRPAHAPTAPLSRRAGPPRPLRRRDRRRPRPADGARGRPRRPRADPRRRAALARARRRLRARPRPRPDVVDAARGGGRDGPAEVLAARRADGAHGRTSPGPMSSGPASPRGLGGRRRPGRLWSSAAR
jgi:hypothetical protein